jgi:hypothetical protein
VAGVRRAVFLVLVFVGPVFADLGLQVYVFFVVFEIVEIVMIGEAEEIKHYASLL